MNDQKYLLKVDIFRANGFWKTGINAAQTWGPFSEITAEEIAKTLAEREDVIRVKLVPAQ